MMEKVEPPFLLPDQVQRYLTQANLILESFDGRHGLVCSVKYWSVFIYSVDRFLIDVADVDLKFCERISYIINCIPIIYPELKHHTKEF